MTKLVQTYFIQSGANGPIKIGISKLPESRLATLQTSNPERLRLLATIDGDHEYELHARFSEFRLAGEWFSMSDSLIDYIRHNAIAYEPIRAVAKRLSDAESKRESALDLVRCLMLTALALLPPRPRPNDWVLIGPERVIPIFGFNSYARLKEWIRAGCFPPSFDLWPRSPRWELLWLYEYIDTVESNTADGLALVQKIMALLNDEPPFVSRRKAANG